MKAKRKKGKYFGGRDGNAFAPWPRDCGTHENYYRLTPYAKALLMELLSQYRGINNGDLTCTWSVLRDRGWRARSTLQKAEKELVDTGWIVKTRQGSINKCNLYGLTFFDLNECDGKLDSWVVGGMRLSWWKHGRPPTE